MSSSLHALAGQIGDFIRRTTAQDSSAHLDGEFDRLARTLFQAQYESNPVYRSWCRQRGIVPSQETSWTDLPALPTTAFKELEVTSIPSAERTHWFSSSGTTAQVPSRHFHHPASLALYETAARAGLNRRWPAPHRPRILGSLTPPPTQAPHSSLVHMFDTWSRDFSDHPVLYFGQAGIDGWTLNGDDVRQHLDSLAQPVLLVGTAFNFVHLLDHLSASARPFRLPEGSLILETGGYKGRSREIPRAELHRDLSHHLGPGPSSIVTEYGMSELSSQAYSTPPSPDGTPPVLQFPPWARARIVSPEHGREVAEGETGIVQIVDLANVWSVLALQTADLAVRRRNGFEWVGRAAHSDRRGCSLMSADAV